MKKVLLVMPKLADDSYPSYAPLGLGYIAAYLRSKKIADVKIIDFGLRKYNSYGELENDFDSEIKKFKPDYIGFSINSMQMSNAVKMGKFVRDNFKKIVTIAGGVHASAKSDECLKSFDIVVLREGEKAVERIIKGKIKKGIVETERLSDIDFFPAYDLLEIEKYWLYMEKKMIGIMGARGCPMNCTFCASPQMWLRKLIVRDTKRIVDEMEFLNKKYSAKTIIFNDDTLNIPLERGIEVCNEIMKRGLHKKMSFIAQIRGNKQFVSEQLFKKFKEANFELVSVGVESGSERVLRAMNKNITLREIKECAKLAKRNKLKMKGFFMVGNREETLIDIFKTWRIADLFDDPVFAVCVPFPGTALYDYLIKNNLMKEPNWDKSTGYTAIYRDKMPKKLVNLSFVFLTWYFRVRNSRNKMQLLLKIPKAIETLLKRVGD